MPLSWPLFVRPLCFHPPDSFAPEYELSVAGEGEPGYVSVTAKIFSCNIALVNLLVLEINSVFRGMCDGP